MKRIEHIMNPLHVYCILVDWGFSKSFAMKLCIFYERFLYKKIFPTLVCRRCRGYII